MTAPASMEWDVLDDGSEVHVFPVDDLMLHEMDEDCPCGPSVQRVETVDGEDVWTYGHWALDGRP